MSRKSSGFTLVELVVVLAISGIAMAFVAMSWSPYWDSARFSNAVRTFHNTLNEARIKAVGYQTTVQLVPRPKDSPANESEWTTATSYQVNQWVKRQGLSYRCIQGHVSDDDWNNPVNEPIRGNNWRTFWDAPTIYFWYDEWFVVISSWTGAAWANTHPYNTVNPINIQFNARGFTADFVDHFFAIDGTAGQTVGHPGISYRISPLGLIVHERPPGG